MLDEAKRQRIFNKYGGRCMLCGNTGELRIHNRTNSKIKDADEIDLGPLCLECYQIVHSPWKVTA